MHARAVVGVGKGALFREVSSVQECPHTEVPLYKIKGGKRCPQAFREVCSIQGCPYI